MPRFSQHWLIGSLPLWIYIILFKAGGSLYYTALPALGERVLPVWSVGLLVGTASLVQLILDVPAGFLLDRLGYVRLLRFTSFALALGGLTLGLFGLHYWTYLALIIMSGIGWLFFGPGVDAYTLTTAPRAYTGRFMSVRRLTSSLGAAIGAVLFTLLMNRSTQTVGFTIGALLIAATLVAFALKKERRSVHVEQKIETHHYYVRRTFLREVFSAVNKLNPASGMLAFSGFAAATFYGVCWFVIPLHLKDTVQAGPFQFALSIFDLTVILCGSFIGKLADTTYKRILVFLGLCLFAIFSTLTSFHLNSWFLVFGFMAAIGDELSSVSLWSWMNHLNRDHAHDGLIASVIGLFQDLGWVIGPVIAGFSYTRLGASGTIFLGAGFICISWALSCIALRETIAKMVHTPFASSPKPHRYPHKD